MDNNGLSIGKLSKITGLTTSAINFYIRNKVIPPPLKTSKTRALFPESSVELLKNTRNAKYAGCKLIYKTKMLTIIIVFY